MVSPNPEEMFSRNPLRSRPLPLPRVLPLSLLLDFDPDVFSDFTGVGFSDFFSGALFSDLGFLGAALRDEERAGFDSDVFDLSLIHI